VPPQPQNPRLAPSFAPRQPLDFDQDERADHDGQGFSGALSFVVVDLRVQLGEGPDTYRAVSGVFADVLGGRLGPGPGVRALHLRSVATGTTHVLRRVAQARVAVKASPGAQTEEDLARKSFEPLLHLDGIVARVEDEQGNVGLSSYFRPSQQSLDLLRGDHVGVLGG
jgi:hypothetical protein